MSNVSLRELLEAGVHFGHQTRRWDPKMKPYIFGSKNGIHIIDLQKTAKCLVEATRFISGIAATGGQILFVGTKKAARDIVREEAQRSGMFFVNARWLGGTMTNFQTVKRSIDRLVALEKAEAEGRFSILTKKEALQLTREIAKMDKSLGGIKNLKGTPQALFVIDPRKEYIAIREANKLKIPVVALCDTNCTPLGIDYVIPGNDDAIKSIRLFTAAIADAAVEGSQVSRSASPEAAAHAADADMVEVVERIHTPEATPDASAEPPAPAVEEATEQA